MDHGIEYLLGLDGVIIEQDYGCWVKFEAKLVEQLPERPHGIKYTLTLHHRNGERILGFDNAHSVNGKFLPRYHKKIIAWDHQHKLSGKPKVAPYDFESAENLIADFWVAVDAAMRTLECEK